jgi:O-antigen ligase
MLRKIGIESWLQFGITICVVLLIVVPTLNEPSAAAVFFSYRTLLVIISILTVIGSRRNAETISFSFLGLLSGWAILSIISIAGIPGSHFDALSIFYRHLLFFVAFLCLAHYNRSLSARWKGSVLVVVVALNLAHLLPALIREHRPVAGFSAYNPNYFGTFLLIGLAAAVAVAAFGVHRAWRIAAAASALVLFFGIVQTSSRGALLAAVAIVGLGAIRAGNRIPRQIWLVAAVGMMILAAVSSPLLVQKFLDRGETDPYNYGRTQIWRISLRIIAEHPVLGVGPGEFFHISKRFNYPVEGQVARYERHIGIAHSEYLQQIAECGIPAAFLLFSILGYLVRSAWKRANTVSPEQRCFQETAILVAAGVGGHALVDNCWTVPVMASAVVIVSLADLVPIQQKQPAQWKPLQIPLASILIGLIYVHSTVIPSMALFYNAKGLRAYRRSELGDAERYLGKAIALVPDYSSFLENLSKVYIAKFDKTHDPRALDLAYTCLKRGIEAGPQTVELYLRMEDVLIRFVTGSEGTDSSWHQRIVENDTQLLQLDPYLPFPRKNLAIAYYNLGQKERAFEEMHKALEYEPNYVPAYMQLASWYGERGDTAAGQQYSLLAMSIVNRYRDFKPESTYQGILLGRPESQLK